MDLRPVEVDFQKNPREECLCGLFAGVVARGGGGVALGVVTPERIAQGW